MKHFIDMRPYIADFREHHVLNYLLQRYEFQVKSLPIETPDWDSIWKVESEGMDTIINDNCLCEIPTKHM